MQGSWKRAPAPAQQSRSAQGCNAIGNAQAQAARLHALLDVAYGPRRDKRLDLFFPTDSATAAPVHLFIHDGYWRMFGKGDLPFVADTLTQASAIAAIMDYSLMRTPRHLFLTSAFAIVSRRNNHDYG